MSTSTFYHGFLDQCLSRLVLQDRIEGFHKISPSVTNCEGFFSKEYKASSDRDYM